MSIFNFSDTFSFQNEFTDDVNANNNQINNMADGLFNNDACTVGQMKVHITDKVFTNSNFENNSITPLKLQGTDNLNNGSQYLNNKGQFSTVVGFENKFTTNVDA